MVVYSQKYRDKLAKEVELLEKKEELLNAANVLIRNDVDASGVHKEIKNIESELSGLNKESKSEGIVIKSSKGEPVLTISEVGSVVETDFNVTSEITHTSIFEKEKITVEVAILRNKQKFV